MKYSRPILVMMLTGVFILTGCFHNTATAPPEKKELSMISEIRTDLDSLEAKHIRETRLFEKRKKKNLDIQPVFPKYNPLEDHKVSFSMVDEKLETILYALADTVGMNLMLDGEIASSGKRVTLSFQDASAKKVLQKLSEQFDFDYQIDGNIIRIKPWAERFFTLNFLDSNVAMGFDVGGDVLGGGSGEQAASGLSGSVTISGKGAEKANPYIILEKIISNIKSKNGIVSINKLSGTLYIKDRPSIVRTVAKMLDHFRTMLSRQILIEARIIEVTLSKGFEYGIDWELLKQNSSASSIELSKLAWNLSKGLVLNGYNGSFSFSSIISALQTFGKVKIVSNPTIRVKHGNPAVISVGDSITYKKSIETTIEKTDIGQTEKTDVEVANVFDGLILGVIPFIEPNGRINLLINPVKSDVDSESIAKPETVGQGISISLPKVGIKEISTTISINNGDTVVLGGLISTENVKRNKGVPVLSRIPVLGYMFKHDYITRERKELVIILNVRIL